MALYHSQTGRHMIKLNKAHVELIHYVNLYNTRLRAQNNEVNYWFLGCEKKQQHQIKRKTCVNTSLKDLSIALNNHGRHGLLSFLSYLPISVLRNLELEANKFYDRANKVYKATLLTRCYVWHFLSPYIDSEVNHKRHFIQIPFINEGMEFIDLHSIFKDNLVISSIPNYCYSNNSETPISCYTNLIDLLYLTLKKL